MFCFPMFDSKSNFEKFNIFFSVNIEKQLNKVERSYILINESRQVLQEVIIERICNSACKRADTEKEKAKNFTFF